MAFVKRYIKFLTMVIAGVILLAGLAFTSFAFSSRQAARAVGGSSPATNSYHERDLVSDIAGRAQFTDPNLVNSWGLSHSPTGPWVISDNGTGFSTQYKSNGMGVPPVITIPTPAGVTTAAPTGNVFNGTSGFVVTKGSASGPSQFIFATEDGTISGWNPNVDPTHAILEVDNSTLPNQGGFTGAVYKGLALASNSSGNFLFATNFRNGSVDVFDQKFAPAHLQGSFHDPNLSPCITDPTIACFAPFGIQLINNDLYVSYAMQDVTKMKHDDLPGPGHGFVDVFDTNGNFIRRFASQGTLNSPWGLAQAPAHFGAFSGDILVGNFGDGRINAFALGSGTSPGTFLGQLKDPHGNLITINGLWGLAFGNRGLAGDTSNLFFASGLNDEADGLFGALSAG